MRQARNYADFGLGHTNTQWNGLYPLQTPNLAKTTAISHFQWGHGRDFHCSNSAALCGITVKNRRAKMQDFRGPKVPVTAYLSMQDLELVKDYANALAISDSAWVVAVIRKALHGQDTPGKALPVTTTALLRAIAEEWLRQLPVDIRAEAHKRVEQRSRELSKQQQQGTLP
jgi:hypothetical protein